MIFINDLVLIGQGAFKHVYEYPNDANKVIKVMKVDNVADDGGFNGHHILRRKITFGVYKQFIRQILQYAKLCKNHYHQNIFTFPIETFYGVVQTDRGLGLVVEKIMSPCGESVTLLDLCKRGQFEDKHAQALKKFFNQCCDLHVVFSEVNTAGIMYTEHRTPNTEHRTPNQSQSLS